MKPTNLKSALRWSLLILGSALAASCGGDTPYYSVQVDAPDTVSITPGENTPVELTLTRIADNRGNIRLSLAQAPEGITLLPEVLLPAEEESITATPTLAVASNTTTTGLVQTLLLAEDPTNEFAAGATFFIVVLPKPAPQPDFSIAVEPRQVNLYAGQSTQVPVTVTRAEGFTGKLTLTFEAATSRVRVDPLTIEAGETTRQLYLYTDRSTTRLPLAATLVATSEDGRKATTGLTLNIR
ncbi:hypothetical protein [Pyxidicoccus sp. MSG2]|uniref:hypothetical protein n=1 Tax=Pyxidicoccus sp. MSG2 TaxID=2996790 RepID=UPI00226D89CE|nr:hypothetical protein [Pyxidicoccus sp. MSG2]MCY1016451.1 hypothetical protein [Pyxidicoccus sp. MSG2]